MWTRYYIFTRQSHGHLYYKHITIDLVISGVAIYNGCGYGLFVYPESMATVQYVVAALRITVEHMNTLEEMLLFNILYVERKVMILIWS